MDFSDKELAVIKELAIEKGLIMVSIVEQIDAKFGCLQKETEKPIENAPPEYLTSIFSENNYLFLSKYCKEKDMTLPEAIDKMISAIRESYEATLKGKNKMIHF